MVNLKIFNEEKPKEDKDVYLKLVEGSDGIEVIAYDSNGNKHNAGSLLKFQKDGTILLYKSVQSALGFKLNGWGQIKVNSEE